MGTEFQPTPAGQKHDPAPIISADTVAGAAATVMRRGGLHVSDADEAALATGLRDVDAMRTQPPAGPPHAYAPSAPVYGWIDDDPRPHVLADVDAMAAESLLEQTIVEWPVGLTAVEIKRAPGQFGDMVTLRGTRAAIGTYIAWWWCGAQPGDDDIDADYRESWDAYMRDCKVDAPALRTLISDDGLTGAVVDRAGGVAVMHRDDTGDVWGPPVVMQPAKGGA